MRKSTLERIGIPYDIDKVENIVKRSAYKRPERHSILAAFMAMADGRKCLVIDHYAVGDVIAGSLRPAFRHFFWQGGYTTLSNSDGFKSKWLTGTLEHYLKVLDYQIMDSDSETAMKSFTGSESPLSEIRREQAKMLEQKLKRKHDRIKAKIDADMETVPPIPKPFMKWVEETALYKSRYLFYIYRPHKKLLEGYCTHCRKNVKVAGARHNKPGKCPSCKSHVMFKAMGKASYFVDTTQADLIQRTTNGNLVIRTFNVYKRYQRPKVDPVSAGWSMELNVHEFHRYILDNKHNKKGERRYEWGYFKSTLEVRWREWLPKCYLNYNYNALNLCPVYHYNLKQLLKKTQWEYLKLHEIATREPGLAWNVFDPILLAYRYPQLEYFHRLGMSRLTEEALNPNRDFKIDTYLDRSKRTPHEALKVTREQFNILKGQNAGWAEVKAMQNLCRAGVSVNADTFKTFLHAPDAHDEFYEYLKMTTPHRFAKYMNRQIQAKKQSSIYDGKNYRYFFSDWRDYISACQKLGMDISSEFVLFPKSFRAAHDKKVAEAQKVENEELDSRAKAQMDAYRLIVDDALKNVPEEFAPYTIVAPENAEDVRREGVSLHHCVGNYISDIARGTSTILFIRKKDALHSPLYTMEIRRGKLVQCRGYRNSTDKPVAPLARAFSEWFEKAYASCMERRTEQLPQAA